MTTPTTTATPSRGARPPRLTRIEVALACLGLVTLLWGAGLAIGATATSSHDRTDRALAQRAAQQVARAIQRQATAAGTDLNAAIAAAPWERHVGHDATVQADPTWGTDDVNLYDHTQVLVNGHRVCLTFASDAADARYTVLPDPCSHTSD